MPTNTKPLLRVFVAAQARLASGSARSERGAGLAEYALLLGLLTVVAGVAVTTLGTTILGAFNNAVAAF